MTSETLRKLLVAGAAVAALSAAACQQSLYDKAQASDDGQAQEPGPVPTSQT